MSAKATAISVLLLGVLGTGAWTAWRLLQEEPADPPENPPAGGGVASKPTLAPVLMKGDALPPKAQQNPRDISTKTSLPDGTYIPNLNGVRVPLTCSGGVFSPIVSIRRTDLGVAWWIHENGMMSTTEIVDGIFNGVPGRRPMIRYAVPRSKTYPVDPRYQQKPPPPGKK